MSPGVDVTVAVFNASFEREVEGFLGSHLNEIDLSHTSPFSLRKHVTFLRCKPFFRVCLGSIRCHIINSKGRHVSVCGLI